MKKYYLTADGGGSKLKVFLYDDEFNIVRTGRVEGVNTLYKPIETVRANIEKMMTEMLCGDDEHEPITHIDGASLCMGGRDIMVSAIQKHATIEDVTSVWEAESGMAAALKKNGVVSLSGTGSNAMFVQDYEMLTSIGGYGPLLGDEGSGYDIGLRALKSALYSFDGRKNKTLLYDIIIEGLNIKSPTDMIWRLSNNPETRQEVAYVAKLCAKAANLGDPVALKIYEKAGMELFRQTRAVIYKHFKEWDGTVVITGGAWKGCERMFETFKSKLETHYPQAQVFEPIFEPVAGAAICYWSKKGMDLNELGERLKETFKPYLYTTCYRK